MTVYVIDQQLQTVTINRRVGSIEPYSGAVPSTENALTGVNWHTKCPWQITLSTGSITQMKLFYGVKYDTEFRSHMRSPAPRLAHAFDVPNAYRLFVRLKGRDEVGWFRGELENVPMVDCFDFDGSNYSVSYLIDWRLAERKQRLSDLCAGETYIPNVMHTSKPSFAGQIEWLDDCSEVCVKFVPKDFYGEYDKWENGMHIQTVEKGTFTINKRGAGKNYIILTNPGITSNGVTLHRGQPYTLQSSSIELQGNDNYILHINEK